MIRLSEQALIARVQKARSLPSGDVRKYTQAQRVELAHGIVCEFPDVVACQDLLTRLCAYMGPLS